MVAQAGRPELAIRRIPMWMLRVVGLWDGVVRELWELRYLFEESVVLDGAKLRRLLPGYADTPIDLAVRATLASYGTSRASRFACRRQPLSTRTIGIPMTTWSKMSTAHKLHDAALLRRTTARRLLRPRTGTSAAPAGPTE